MVTNVCIGFATAPRVDRFGFASEQIVRGMTFDGEMLSTYSAYFGGKGGRGLHVEMPLGIRTPMPCPPRNEMLR